MQLQIIGNKIKTTLIIGLIFLLLAVVVYFVSCWLGYTRYALVIAVGLSVITSIISYWNCSKIVLKMNRAQPADPSMYQDAHAALKRVCFNAEIDIPKLYIMNDSSPNAFATGRSPKDAVVCLTTGLVDKLDYYQLEGVIAHEVAHIKNYDILLSTIASVMIGAVIMASDVWSRSLWFSSSRRNRQENSNKSFMAIIGIVFIILSPIAAQLLRFALSRNREYLADSSGASYTGNPEGLASALEVIAGDEVSMENFSKATASMFISDPLYASNKNIASSLFSTHPPIYDRVRKLRMMK